jgi:hypothetical protein
MAVDVTSKLKKERATDKTWKGLTEAITKSDKCLDYLVEKAGSK